MRITNPTLLRGYNRDLNRVLNLKNQSEHKITTQRKFSRASEDPLSAAKALNVRKSQYYSAQHQENLKVAAKFYTEAETSLIQVSEQMATIRETIIAACNTTKDYQDYDIYAQQLETKARELCEIFNTDSAGRAIFGGESDNGMPFAIIDDESGFGATVTYHGVPVNAMNDYTKFPYSDDVNVDIGLGMVVDQATHEIDSASVLRISFNGPEVTGCGAERGVADVDLSSIVQNRSYSLYVYAGDVKKEINFTGQATQAENVAEINRVLKEAYKKEIAFKRNYPEMDDQGVISLRDSMGDAVEDGIVCVVNNTNAKRTAQLKVDNDSNYTDKYRLRLSELVEGATYKVDVQIGDGEKKTIEFEAGADNLSDPNKPIYREDVTVKNFQAALDAAFGEGVVTISPNDPTKGIITTEGDIVKLYGCADGSSVLDDEHKRTEGAAVQISVDGKSIAMSTLKDGEDYALAVSVDGATKYVNFTYDAADTAAMEKAFKDQGLTLDTSNGKVTSADTGKAVDSIENNRLYEQVTITTQGVDSGNALSLDIAKLEEGTTYAIYAAIGNSTDRKKIVFEAGKTVSETKRAIADAFDKTFVDGDGNPQGSLKINTLGEFEYTKSDGTVTYVDLTKVADAYLEAGETPVDLGKHTMYTIDLDALEEGKSYSLNVICENEMKTIDFVGGADAAANAAIIKARLDNAFGMSITFNNGTLYGHSFSVYNNPNTDGKSYELYERESAYSNNYIQLTLDAARALRDGNIAYANGCIDRIVMANEKLLVEIANMGCNEEFIDFNLSRLTIRDENLAERQNDLEIIDSAKEITLWKQYESMYNACLQMSSSAIPQSIFNYIG